MFLDIQIKKAITVIRTRGYETPGRKTRKEIRKPKKKKAKRKERGNLVYWYQFTI